MRLLAILLALATTPLAPASGAGSPALVVDVTSAHVLHEVDATRLWYPASLTKVMTLYLAFEALDAGRLRFDQAVEVSARAAAQPAVRLGLRAGDRISVRDALLAVITRSANDAAVILAEAVAGHEREFARRMTAQARRLGMHASRFRNATGLPDPEQVTTARDMALLARGLIQRFPEHYRLFSTHAFSFRGRRLLNRNAILGRYPGADGLKTGFTCGSGYNLIASSMRDGRRLVGVVLGSRSRAERARRMISLLDDAFARSDPGETRVQLSGLADPSDAVAPPHVLSAAECQSSAASKSRDLRSTWGLLFGVFRHEEAARSAVRAARRRLEPVAAGGQEWVVRRDLGGGRSWKALLVGYGVAEAGRACRHLRAQDMICVAQSPQVLTHPGYARQ